MEKQTTTGELRAKKTQLIEWREPEKKRRSEELLKNLAVAAALVLCAVTLRGGAIPGATGAADAVLAATTGETLLDDQLGKLSFVSRLFPEATLVFGENHKGDLALPVSGGMVAHAWSEAEPYMTWRTEQQEVYAAMSGVVMGVFHGENEERLVQVTGENGISCLYGNLKKTDLQTGDAVSAGDMVGVLLENSDCVFEVRVDGISVDPAAYLANVS
ncbi:MAG: M23 family metallopeptidase [Clostridiales bacterium]|nr:M23 family metallopeptidase [Clostridiales bacterium]